jgi:hypothetical protein
LEIREDNIRKQASNKLQYLPDIPDSALKPAQAVRIKNVGPEIFRCFL